MIEHDPYVEHQKELERQWQEQERIFAVCNASLRAALMQQCPISAPTLETCLNCGDTQCFDSWREQNRLWGITDEQSLHELRFMQNTKQKTKFAAPLSPKTKEEPNDGRSLFDLAA